MSTKKELIVEEQIQQALLKQNAELEKKQLQREANNISIGARVIKKEIIQGSPIIDKDTKQQRVNPQTGEPMHYASKFRVEFQFFGGSLTRDIAETEFHSLDEMRTYYCQGHLGEVNSFGNVSIQPILSRFTQI